MISEAVIERESGDRLLEWGGKLFYFDGRKCIQLVNFASKLTLFLFDINKSEFGDIGNDVAHYLMDIYDDDRKMKRLLERLFDEYPFCVFSKLTDKSIISTLNHTQLYYADDGYLFYRYLRGGILHTREINKEINSNYLFTQKVGNKTDYYCSKERFKESLEIRYKNK